MALPGGKSRAPAAPFPRPACNHRPAAEV